MTDLPWLTVLIAVPLVGALVVGFLPQRPVSDGVASRSALPKLVALGVSLLTLAVAVAITLQYHVDGGMQLTERHTWIDALGVSYALGVDGLGLLDVCTEFAPDKVLRLPTGTALGVPASGYEIHHGRVTRSTDRPLLAAADGAPEGSRRGAVHGTHWHGLLANDRFRRRWLTEVAATAGPMLTPVSNSSAAMRDARRATWSKRGRSQ